MEIFKKDEIIWIVNNVGVVVYLYKCKVVEQTQLEINVEILNKNNKSRSFYIYQPNTKFIRNKYEARSIFIALACKKRNLSEDFERVYKIIKENTGLNNISTIRIEIDKSQSQFPELWL